MPSSTLAADRHPLPTDLVGLAWVQDAVRQSLDAATQALRQAIPDALASDDTPSALHQALQHLHRTTGALDMVGVPAAARVLQAMEAAVHACARSPALCNADALACLEHAGLAVSDHLARLVAGQPASSAALFAPYCALMALAGAERMHPADLWAHDWQWVPVMPQPVPAALPCSAELRARLDQAVLKLVKHGDTNAAARLAGLCAGLAAGPLAPALQSFWTLAAGFFQALGEGRIAADVYAKRTASRMLQQYAALARGDAEPSRSLAHELLYFCAQAQTEADASTDVLQAVRQAYGLDGVPPPDHAGAPAPQFDPAQQALARQRMAAAAQGWSALAAGDASRMDAVATQLGAVSDSILALYPQSQVLAQALDERIHAMLQAGTVPTPAVALEVATALLYLEAACAEAGPDDAAMAARAAQLAWRLHQAGVGADAGPLEPWMEALYRHVSETQTMDRVVGELRAALGEVEAELDRFFLHPTDPTPLQELPQRLAQMGGVFAVLGLEQPAQAAQRMASDTAHLLAGGAPPDSAVSAALANNVGALGLLIDMLRCQRGLAQSLFVFDAASGALQALLGRDGQPLVAPAAPAHQAPQPVSEPAAALDADETDDADDTDTALQTIFLDEARAAVPEAPAEPAATTDFADTRAVQPQDFLATTRLDRLEADVSPRPPPPPPITLEFPPDSLPPAGVAPPQAPEVPAPPPPTPPAPVPVPPLELVENTDHTKVIGALRVGIALYNVFLNEADEWSRRLLTELSEWALELHRPVPDAAIVLAHALAGSSATVGFTALSELARLLEHALEQVQRTRQGTALQAQVFNDAAEDLRRLLHQFAAGFLKSADPHILDALRSLLAPAAPANADAKAPAATWRAWGGPAQDALDADLFAIFQDEALERMPSLGMALRQWVARPDNLGARAEALRVLHTLKGSARLAGAMRLGDMAHQMESGIDTLGTHGLKSAQLEPLLAQLDALQAALDALDSPAQPAEAPAAPLAQPAAPAHAAASAVPLAAPMAGVSLAARAQPGPSVRVRTQLLDRLVNQAGEVLISRSRLEGHATQMRGALTDVSANLDRLRQQLRDVELQAESQMQSRMASSQEDAQIFDPLEFDRFTRMQELTRMMAESVNDVATLQRQVQRSLEGAEDEINAQGRQARELQRDLLRTRMVEFESIAERLYGVVRQAAKESGKPVRLDIVGGMIEMDRGVLDRMTPAFEHLLRNAVVHGVEDAATRAAAGKAEMGSISITVQQENNDVWVEFADDGAGLQLDKIRARAVARKLVAADQAVSDADAVQWLFAPGFSTADAVTELSGRGIGMDVVQSEVNALGGLVQTRTQAGQGTSFRLVLPLTTAVTQVVMLRMGALRIGVPTGLVETVLRAPQAQVAQAYADGQFLVDQQALPFFWGGALLQVSGCSGQTQTSTLPVVVLRSAGQRLALHVDEVLGQREVVVKNLGPQLARLPGLAGMSVLASGAVVLIYNPVALAALHGAAAAALTQASAAAADRAATEPASVPLQAPLVLVVDDSITVRRVTQRLLQREGFRVALAHDGVQALEALAQERPVVVLSDIEMPRMDGFDLVRTMRADAGLRDVPVVMITSRMAQKHRDHAHELGVNHYLGKPYSEEELLGLIRSYCAAFFTTP